MNARHRGLAAVCLIGACGGSLLAHPAMAQETRWRLQASASGGYANNPFNGGGINDAGEDGGDSGDSGSTGSAYLRARLRPQVSLLWARDTLFLRGDVDYKHYLRRYSDDDAYNAEVSFRHRINSLDSFTLGASFRDYRNNIGLLDGASDDNFPVPVDPAEDLGLIGTRVRRYAGTAGANFALSQNTSIVVSGGVSRLSYGSADVNRSYTSYRSSASIMRRLSVYTSVGIGGGVVRTNYDNRLRPDSTVYSLFGTGTIQITATWSLSGQAGLSLVRQQVSSSPFLAGGRSQQGITGNLQFCRKGEFDQLCLVAARDYQPTASLGTIAQSTAGANYRRQISEHGNLSAAVTYLQTKRGDALGIGNRYLRSTIGYDHTLSERLSLSASVFHRKLIGESRNEPTNYGGQIGLNYVFGDLR